VSASSSRGLAERIYAATATFAAGAWLAAACLLGPFTSPLPQVLGVGALILAIPWWAHHWRRAKDRVARTLAAWPDISAAIGLPGSQVMSAAVDLWGWRARLRLARGQTIADVTARIPAIESALGAFRVHPTPDDKANRCELRMLSTRTPRRSAGPAHPHGRSRNPWSWGRSRMPSRAVSCPCPTCASTGPQKRLVEATVTPSLHMCKGFVSEGDLNTNSGEISLDRGNHAIRVTRVGSVYPATR
jgi:hypothetical protein